MNKKDDISSLTLRQKAKKALNSGGARESLEKCIGKNIFP
jgi:hypothetical protein